MFWYGNYKKNIFKIYHIDIAFSLLKIMKNFIAKKCLTKNILTRGVAFKNADLMDR